MNLGGARHEPRKSAARSRAPAAALVGALLLLGGACSSPAERKVEADRETYRALDANRRHVPEVAGSMDVDRADAIAAPAREIREATVDLEGALRLAALSSREYLTRREDVYLTALAYTGERHAFESQGFLGGNGNVAASESETVGAGRSEASLSKALESGGSVVLKIASDFLRAFTNNPLVTARTVLSADLVKPLLRGSGTTVARESLTQAERDVLYALRDFARFQQQLIVDVVTGFYRVLESRDTLANEELSYQSLLLFLERAKAFGPEGARRLPDFEVDQARQDVLRADDRRVRAQQAYEAALDDFKQVLGLPTRAKLIVREDALDVLRARGIVSPTLDLPHAIAEALARRLDLATARDRFDDAKRKAVVAADGLGTQLDLKLGGGLTGPQDRPLDFDSLEPFGSIGLDVDLPLERTLERNAYRTALIQAQRARREIDRTEDDVLLDVRRDHRELEQARQSYTIQKEGVRLAERRVESAKLNLQAGKAVIRDVLDAENALVSARNALTSALVEHAVARLSLERDVGTLSASILDAQLDVRSAAACGAPAAAGTKATGSAGG